MPRLRSPKSIAPILLAIVALALALTAACAPTTPATPTPTPEGNTLEDWTLPAGMTIPDMTISAYQGADHLGGEEVRLSEILGQGKPVILNFWAALCPPCRAEMPDFQRVFDTRSHEIIILGIDIGPQQHLGTRDQGRQLLSELGITYPAGTTFSDTVARDYRILGMPATLFIHADGRLMRTWNGIVPEARMHQLIDELLEG